MSIVAISAAAITAAVLALTLRPKNGEVALLLTAAASGISTGYVAILLKVIGICMLTEFTAGTCRDAGSSALAANVTFAGKILVTVTALPLYADILNTVLSILQR